MVLKGIHHDFRKELTQGQAFSKVIGVVNLDYLFLHVSIINFFYFIDFF